MKKVVSIVVLLSSIASANTVDKLSPELDSFMTLKPIPEEYFDNNAYIGWMGLMYPKDNWLTAYKKVFQANDVVLNERIEGGKLLTNYFANPRQAIFQLSSDQTFMQNLFGEDDGLMNLEDGLDSHKLLAVRQGVFENKRYRYTQDFFVCADYSDDQCFDTMKERRDYIHQTIRENRVLLDRFEELVQVSQYNYALFYNDYNASLDVIPSSGMAKLIQLYLTEAMMKIADGKVDEGLDQLVIVRRWIDLMFHEKSKTSLLHFFVNISVTQFLDQTMDVLLDEHLLDQSLDDERVSFIVRPYPNDIGQKLNEVVLFEIQQNFKDFAYPYIKVYHTSVQDITLTEEDEYIILSFLKNFGVILSPSLNELYQTRKKQAKTSDWAQLKDLLKATKSIDKMWFNAVHQKQDLRPYVADEEGELEFLHHSHEKFIQVLNDWYRQYFQKIGMMPKEALFYLNDRYPSTQFYNDYHKLLTILSEEDNLKQHLSSETLNMILQDQVHPETLTFTQSLIAYSNFDSYWMRLYEQQNYHQLVYLKYLIMRDKIASKDVSKFLRSMGHYAENTITKVPYQYDRLLQKLSTPLPRTNKDLPSHIKILRLNNSNIQHFEVRIPQY